MNFNELKELLAITDGNLASHLKTLEESEFVKAQKGFIGRKTNTTYSITKSGEKHLKDTFNSPGKDDREHEINFLYFHFGNTKYFLNT